MNLQFIDLPNELQKGTDIMLKHMNIQTGGTKIHVIKSDKLETGFKSGEGYIKYIEKHHFFRLLGLFAEHFKGEEFCISQEVNFDTLCAMLDMSAGAAPTVNSIKEYLRYMAIMGFNQLQLYIEDMYEIPDCPHFGYMRGKYTSEELREIDDYAFCLGIEAVPCIQTLGHLQNYLRWGMETADIAENTHVLLPDDDKTYEFIEKMIVNSSKNFRSNRIHVGLDETHGLGLGTYLKKHGYTEPINIFVKHVARVTELCVKHNLRPMMWSDMFFCLSSDNYGKYERETELSPKVLKGIPKEMQMVFWHYGEKLDADAYMIDKHRQIGNDIMYAGGVWIWPGALPDNIFSSLGSEIALKTCKEKGIRELMLTVWTYATTSMFHTSLLEMQRYAEHCYSPDSSKLKERFEFCTGASYEAFIRMSDFHAMYNTGKDYDSLAYDERFFGNKIHWQDIMLGIIDDVLIKEPRSAHYSAIRDIYLKYIELNDKWQWLYTYCYKLFDFMSTKCYIAEHLSSAYKAGDIAMLKDISDKYLPKLFSKTEALSYDIREQKEKYNKPFGLEETDIMYGGLKERIKTSKLRLDKYLNGEISSLDELSEPRLPISAQAWGLGYQGLAHIIS